ncbi:Glutamate--tRNA ligase [Buchnera aphidicola (Eriosoma grossulariae)]|uniref:glutamate--tRNA ligase n=1 Tax=Buchnera aphidicola TaxID=9 RepID=UPI003464381A
MKIKTRFSPSPTGNLHIGSVRTALYAWLFAKKNKGSFVLRIEDTDLERSNLKSVKSIIDGLKWLGLNWDEGPYFQSQRLIRYQKVIDFMLHEKLAYRCYCSVNRLDRLRSKQLSKGLKPRYDHHCRNLNNKDNHKLQHVVRFRNPLTGSVTFNDLIRGKIIHYNNELDDLIIQRSNGMPTYNFVVVIDDVDMDITHVIRGEDHVSNTPRQINIFNALSKKEPVYAHVSMILNHEGKKLSKRDVNVSNIIHFRELGFLPESILNYLVRLGWSYGNQELFTMNEMIEFFSFDNINNSASIFNIDKMLWYNNYYINNLPKEYIINLLHKCFEKEKIDTHSGPNMIDLITIMGPRCNTLKKIVDDSIYFYVQEIDYDLNQIKLYLDKYSILILKMMYKKIFLMVDWNLNNLSGVIKECTIQLKISFKKAATILRLALSGKIYTPSISLVLYYIGKKRSLIRIKDFLLKINDLNF